MVYRTVIVPAILPELRGGIAVALTFSWSLALGAELVGIQDGLGRMMILALRFDQVARMVIIAAVFVALAASTVILFNRLADRAIRWAA
jgi:sulfonate transport system permease protein